MRQVAADGALANREVQGEWCLVFARLLRLVDTSVQALVDQMQGILANYYEYNYLDYCPENVFGKRRRAVASRDANPIGGPIVRPPCAWLRAPV